MHSASERFPWSARKDREGFDGYYRMNDSILHFHIYGTNHKKEVIKHLFSRKVKLHGKAKVHRGWLDYAKVAAVLIDDIIQANLIKTDGSKRHIFLTGHSLGAAGAQIIALILRFMNPSLIISVECYGAPRVGNKYFCNMFDEEEIPLLRIEMSFDRFVTRVPLKIMGYRHAGPVKIYQSPKPFRIYDLYREHQPSAYNRYVKTQL